MPMFSVLAGAGIMPLSLRNGACCLPPCLQLGGSCPLCPPAPPPMIRILHPNVPLCGRRLYLYIKWYISVNSEGNRRLASHWPARHRRGAPAFPTLAIETIGLGLGIAGVGITGVGIAVCTRHRQ